MRVSSEWNGTAIMIILIIIIIIITSGHNTYRCCKHPVDCVTVTELDRQGRHDHP